MIPACPAPHPRRLPRLSASPRLALAACIASLFVPRIALAQPVVAPASTEVVVTAARAPQRVDETVSDVTVVDRAQIERMAGRNLSDLLALQPGVQAVSNGGLGGSTSVFLRGGDARHTLLLIDGVRYGSATLGQAPFENIPLEQIERIEIVRGPLSSLYGSDAVGGVIQVFTRRGMTGDRPSANLTLGSDNYRGAGVSLRGGSQDGRFDYSLGAQHQRTDGISAKSDRSFAGRLYPDRDGFEQSSLSFNAGMKLDEDWRARVFAFGSQGTAEYDDFQSPDFPTPVDPATNTRLKLRSSTAGFSLDGRVTPIWRTQFRVAESRDVNDTVASDDAFSLGAFRTRQTQFGWQNNLVSPVGNVLLAVEQLRQRVGSDTTAYDVTARTVDSVLLGLNGSAAGHHWQASARNDRNSQFGTENTGSVGYGYDLTPNWRVSAAAGTTFVAPSFNQLYFPDFGTPTLQPERGRQKEASIRYAAGGHEVKLTAFDNRIRGFITPGPNPVNVRQTRIEGWTLAYTGRVGPLRLAAALDLQDPRDESTGLQLVRRARQAATLAADWVAERWSAGATFTALGDRPDLDFDAGGTRTRLAGHGLLSLRARQALSRDWELSGRIDNLTDRRYEDIYGFSRPGRQFFVTLRWLPR